MKNLKSALILALLSAISSPAFAQLTKGKTMLTDISSWMTSIGAVIVTIALMFVGFRMVFQAAEWKDVAPVFWGGVVIGGAAGIADMLIK
ncbi:TrbC/VirB2 family protein [Oxalobacteraceae bacterium]|nr:TrbC/VirB2 family protein [Oxalobacteraceae bacterium]